MSARATFWAWDQSIKPASAKLVLLCLADCHNGDNGRCDPSIKYIAKCTGLDRKTVMKNLGDLQNMGHISAKKRTGTSTTYNIQTSTNNGTGTENGTSTNNGTGVVPKTVPPPVPKTVPKPKRNLKENLSNVTQPDNLNFLAWEKWVGYRKRKKKPVSADAAIEQYKLLAKYSQEDQAQIINKSISSDYQGLFAPKENSSAGNQRSGKKLESLNGQSNHDWRNPDSTRRCSH